MTDGPAATGGAPDTSMDAELDQLLRDPYAGAWFEEHQAEMRRSVSGQYSLYWSLGIGFVIGLAAHIGGYVLRTSTAGGALDAFDAARRAEARDNDQPVTPPGTT
jgi:hypothetical protein